MASSHDGLSVNKSIAPNCNFKMLDQLGTRLLGLSMEGWRSAHPKLAAWAETNLAEGFTVFGLPPE